MKSDSCKHINTPTK